MILNNWHSYKRVLALLIAVCLLAGCAGSNRGAPTESATAPDYEVYTKDSLEIQKTFDDLCNRLFTDSVTASALTLHYTLADPAAYGIQGYPITFGKFSVKEMQSNLQDMKTEADLLKTIDPELLTDEQQLTYRLLEEQFETELSSEGMELYYQPLAPTIGLQAQLPILLSEYAFYSKTDIENYLALLAQTDEYFTQILAFEKEQSAAGLFMNDASLEQVLDSCDAYILTPERSFLSETFTQRLAEVPDLTEEEIADYTARNLTILAEDFIRAYQLLSDGLKELKGTGTNEKGMCFYPKGTQYYEYLVRSATGTTYETIDALRDAIQEQMDKDLIAMSKIMKEHPTLGEEVLNYKAPEAPPEQILESLIAQIKEDFPELPACSYDIKMVPSSLENALSPAFYLVPPLDRYQENTIYINQSKTDQADQFALLAHEGYPGHLYQNVYFMDQCTENIRSVLSYSGYSEGWATYVEHYSYSLDNGMEPAMSQMLAHNASSSMAIHAMLDLYINYYGWSKDQVKEYMENFYLLEDDSIVDTMYTTLIGTPTNYLEYYVGYLEILQMKELAETTLGDKFNLKEFHTFLLDMGPAPFTVMEPYFKTWLMTSQL